MDLFRNVFLCFINILQQSVCRPLWQILEKARGRVFSIICYCCWNALRYLMQKVCEFIGISVTTVTTLFAFTSIHLSVC